MALLIHHINGGRGAQVGNHAGLLVSMPRRQHHQPTIRGLSLALEGLLKGTQNIRPDPSNFQNAHLNPGANTAEAIYNGALLSLVALIETSYQNLLKTHSQAKLILAGGDAPIVGSHIGCQFELIEDLVFQGMRLLDEAGLVECIS